MTEQGVGHRKTCSTCKEEFYIPDGQHRARAYCGSCQRLHRVARDSLRSGNPIPHDHRCECCGKSAEELTTHYSRHGNPISPWRLDHCHETSEFRGWLCMNCNSGLGKFYDDVGILRNAIEYIQKHRP
jgi:hypothetical protein